MIVQLRHRGPDGYGFYQDQGVGLAHARLSIIDLSGGSQPIHNEDQTVWVVFNGEIFNYIELRQDLLKAGHKFYTHSDTEVIVHLYEEYGDDFARHLNGQFAIALWDKPKQRLVLVRDRPEVLKPGTTAKVRQVAYIVERAHKMLALGRILDVEQPTSAIVFCRTRTEVDELTETMNARGYAAAALHGGLSQEQRDRVMKKFRSHASDLLIATDVAARGLDVQHVSHVVNFDVPAAADAYVHRIGRTGRAGRTGLAITLVGTREQRMLRNFERVTGQPIEIALVPTVADLKARQLEQAQAALREVILAGSLDPWRGIVTSLAEEFDVMDVAAAAVKQAAMSGAAAQDQEEIPASRPARERHAGGDRGGKGEAAFGATRRVGGAAKFEGKAGAKGANKGPRAKTGWKAARLYVGGGRKAKIRPGDLVGAIANEMGIDASNIGAITMSERHAIVEVPESMADDIVRVLSATTIQGKRVLVRRDRDPG